MKNLLAIFSIILLISLLKGGTIDGEIIMNNVITSIVSTPAYLIGANISRTIVLKVPLSLKILYYIIVVIILVKLFG